MVTRNTKYYLDGYLEKEVGTIQRRLKRKWDCVGIFDGREGGGKTTLAFQVCKAIDPTFNIKRVCFSEKQFYEQIINATSGMAICLDEAMNVFFSRASMSRTNISMVRVLAECRKRNLFLALVMPSYFEMDRYPALHRASFLCHIYAMPTAKGDMARGYFRWYDRKAKKKLYLLGKKFMSYGVSKPTFYGRFVKKFVVNEKEYEAKKDKALMDMQREVVGKREKFWKDKCKKLYLELRKCKGMTMEKFIKYLKGIGISCNKHDLVEENNE